MDTAGSRQSPISPALFLIGFSSVIAQIVLMRELIVVYHGNEISLGVILASWLFWTALGSGLFGKLSARRLTASPRKTVAVLELLVAVALPLSIVAVRGSRVLHQPTTGELLGPAPMFVTSALVLSFFCLVSGALFAAGSRLHSSERGSTTPVATGSVYLLEAAGSCVGGIASSLVLIRVMSAFEIALLVSILNIVAAWNLTRSESARRRIAPIAAIVIIASIVWPFAGRMLESFSNRMLWRGFELIDVRNSKYGNFAVVATGDTKSIYENGMVLSTVPDREAAEETVHYALLQHESPASLLLIGGGSGGSLIEALRHGSIKRIDYVELDPVILELAEHHFAGEWAGIKADPRITIHHTDGRLFLKQPGPKYDVIILDLPDPQTAQLNRFYSKECFEDAAARLAPRGLVSFRVTGAENYISDDLAGFLQCINKTVRAVFPRVTAIPGATIHFFAASERGATTSDSNVLLQRLRNRRIQTQYVNESFIPFRMAPDRMQDLHARIKPEPTTPINRDLSPIAYYFNVALWSAQFNQGYRRVFDVLAAIEFNHLAGSVVVVLVLIAIPIAWRFRSGKHPGLIAGYVVAAMGFTTICLEVVLLLGFQAVYGFVYHQLAILIAAFMTGMAAGGHVALRRISKSTEDTSSLWQLKPLLALQLAAAVFPVALVGIFVASKDVSSSTGSFAVSHLLFPILAVAAGGLGGYQFPIAGSLYFRAANAGALAPSDTSHSNPGSLYALDLAGACLGAIVVSTYLIPVFGFAETAVAIAAINIAPALLLAVGIIRVRR